MAARILGGTQPQQVNVNQKYDTGIPGFDMLTQSASQNISDLLSGAPSLARNRNAGATYAASMGLPAAGGTGDFMDRYNYDLYGTQAQANKQQGLGDLLSMLQGYSGTAVARPGDILSAQSQAAQRASTESMAANELGQRQYEFGRTFPESVREFNAQLGLQQSAQDLQRMLGVGGLNLQTLNSYLNFLQ